MAQVQPHAFACLMSALIPLPERATGLSLVQRSGKSHGGGGGHESRLRVVTEYCIEVSPTVASNGTTVFVSLHGDAGFTR